MAAKPKAPFRFTMFTPTIRTDFQGSIADGISQAFWGVQTHEEREKLLMELNEQHAKMTSQEYAQAATT